MKKIPRVTSLAIIGAILLGTAGTVSAWTNYNYGSRVADCGDVMGEALMAADGDVVTIKKWNTAVCLGQGVYNTLADWNRQETPFVWGDTGISLINGKEGAVMSGIGLGYTTSGAGWPFIGFFNADYGYAGAFGSNTSSDRPAMGVFQFLPKSRGFDDTMRLSGFAGGIKIEPGDDSSALNKGSYLLGWEKISTTSTDPFDSSCQYRVVTGDSHTVHPFVTNTNVLVFYGDSSADVTVMGVPSLFFITQDSKSVLRHKTPGDVSYGTSVASIEKLCLPAYNPNNIP